MSFVYGLLTRRRWPTAVPESGQHGPPSVRAAESGGAACPHEGSASDRIRTAISRSLRALELHAGVGRGAAVRSGERVLDVACGNGSVTLPAAWAVGPEGHVLATDISEAMVRRALRPGGRAVVAIWGARARCGWAEIFPIVDRRVRSDVCPPFYQLGTGDALAEAFALAGFEAVASERISTTLRYRSARGARWGPPSRAARWRWRIPGLTRPPEPKRRPSIWLRSRRTGGEPGTRSRANS
jgi:SAM-dependent methyltransferase